MIKIIISFYRKWINQAKTIDELTKENITLIEKISEKTK